MFYYISGTLVIAEINTVVIDAGGIGYSLTVSENTVKKIAGSLGSFIKLFTYLAVREDAVELYGFATQEELTAFKLLISVSGVGAKSAISILSIMLPERLATAVMTGDSKLISKAQGIGAKTAARIVLELKDKIGKQISAEDGTVYSADFDDYTAPSDNISEAVNALLVLGYTKQDAIYALKGEDKNSDLEVLIKHALAKLVK